MGKISMAKISLMVGIAFFAILFAVMVTLLNFGRNGYVSGEPEESYRIGVIMNGTRDDRSWGQSHYDALMRVAGDLGAELICLENIPADESFDAAVKELAEEENCGTIAVTSSVYGESVSAAAEKYPGVNFLHAAGAVSGDNLCTFSGRMYQYRYLCGIIAGTQTKSGRIGYAASLPSDEVNRDINAFTLGVRSVASDAQVFVSFCGSWTDGEKARASAEKLIGEYDTDVLTHHTDSLAPLEAASEHGVPAIGCNFDNSDIFPEIYLTGCVLEWDSFYREQLGGCIRGNFSGGSFWLGTESGIMKLVEPEKTGIAVPGYEKPLKDALDRLDARSFDVFYGPVTDNNGVQRIAEGESMSDGSMLRKFDWYAEGVVIVD